MSYDLKFRLSVVEYYAQVHSALRTAKKFAISKRCVLNWVRRYEANGVLGIEPRRGRTTYSPAFKQRVLQLMEAEKLSFFEVSLRFNIASAGTVASWQRRYQKHGLQGLTDGFKSGFKGGNLVSKKSNPYIVDKPDSEKTVAELKRELKYLRAENDYLKKLDALLKESQK